MPDKIILKIVPPTWRRCRLDDSAKSAWVWCVNNELTTENEKGTVVDSETMEMVTSISWLADCVFEGTERKQRLEKERFIRIMCQ